MVAGRLLSQSSCSTAKNSSGGGSAAGGASSSQAVAAADTLPATARLGAEAALRALCERFGAGLFQALPSLWLQMSGAMAGAAGADGAPVGDPQGLIHAMQVRYLDGGLNECLAAAELVVRILLFALVYFAEAKLRLRLLLPLLLRTHRCSHYAQVVCLHMTCGLLPAIADDCVAKFCSGHSRSH